MLIIAKIFASLLAILVIARSIVDFKNKRESITMTIFWVAVWAAILVLAFWPNLIDNLIQLLGGQRTGLGTVFGMAIAFVLFVNYRIYVKANRVEKYMARLARQLALETLGKDR